MLLSLITPVGSNFLKDWPLQNGTNLDRIDSYASSSLISHPLQSYTPQLTALTLSPTLGTGGVAVLRGFYYRIFDQIYSWGEFRFGSSGMNAGSGIYKITLPFEVNTSLGASTVLGEAPVIGLGDLWVAATPANRQPVTAHLRTTTTIEFSVKTNSSAGSREVTHNAPVAWAAGDGISWCVRYQRVP